MEEVVVGKEKKAEEVSKGSMETERIQWFAGNRVEAAQREVYGMEQQRKEARRRLTSNQEKAALASMEERDTLVRKGNACQDIVTKLY